jgi:hypothetical protein
VLADRAELATAGYGVEEPTGDPIRQRLGGSARPLRTLWVSGYVLNPSGAMWCATEGPRCDTKAQFSTPLAAVTSTFSGADGGIRSRNPDRRKLPDASLD